MKKIFSILSVLAGLAGLECRAQSVLLDCEFINDSDYGELARAASEIGATHLHCTAVEPSMWQWDRDRNDPYPNWSILRPSVFKLYVPAALEKYLPADYAKKNLEKTRKRVEILDKYGLKPIFSGFDPAYLPEEVYADHPEWRGPRCDQTRRARAEYYAPCVDNPEMRAMYVEAVTEICKVIPYEKFDLLVNDSGSGLCWYPHLYPGPNGPDNCKDVPVWDRIVNFLSMFQEGARNAGVEKPVVNLARYLDESIVTSTLPHLKPGQFVLNRNMEGSEGYAVIGFPNFYDTFFPVSQMPRIACIARQVQQAQGKGAKNLEIGLRGVQETDAIRYMKRYLKEPTGQKASDLERSLEWLASTFVGESDAYRLVEIWNDIEKIETFFAAFQTGGHMFRLGTVHQRWLTRPFVVFPEELTGKDRDYWRSFIFQAGSEEDAMDMTMLQAHKWLGGYGGLHHLMKTCSFARPILKADIRTAQALEALAVDEESRLYLHGMSLRLRFFRRIMENAVNAVEFQYMMDEVGKPDTGLKDNTCMIQYQGDARYTRLAQLIREEVDNCGCIIEILDEAEKSGVSLAVTCGSPETENIMHLSPTLKQDLQRKMRIMNEHRGDINRIMLSPNH